MKTPTTDIVGKDKAANNESGLDGGTKIQQGVVLGELRRTPEVTPRREGRETTWLPKELGPPKLVRPEGDQGEAGTRKLKEEGWAQATPIPVLPRGNPGAARPTLHFLFSN